MAGFLVFSDYCFIFIIMENNERMNNPQAMKMKQVGFFMNVAMGVTVSIILSTHGVVSSGHFTVPTLLISMAISCILALCIGFFLPVRQVKEKFTGGMKMPAKHIIGNIITNIFYVLIITSVNTTLMILLARHNMDINNVPPHIPRPEVLKALPRSLLSSFIVSYIVTLFIEPFYLKLAFKKYGINSNNDVH